MGKISPVSAKYTVHAQIHIDGVVDRPDVIGAIFGQTEGLLGSELELRELQRSGRIGRIEVKIETKLGKSDGEIIVPSSLDKAETAIIGAALETIQRIGPCESKIKVVNIEDVRISKRNQVIDRAKDLLRELTSKVLPDSQEITDQVAQSVRMMEITEYGKERLAAGPGIEESEEIVVVEGRADVLNLLKNGIKNSIALNGTSIPDTIKILGKKKAITLFVDGDRGGNLIIRGLINAGVELDHVIRAPDGKEVEELTKKEIHKALRSKITIEQVKLELASAQPEKQISMHPSQRRPQNSRPYNRPNNRSTSKLSSAETKKFKELQEDLVGTRGAYLLDEKLNVLGKVPTSELISTIKNVGSVYAIIFDGVVDRDVAVAAERSNVKYLVGNTSRIRPNDYKSTILTSSSF
ncbi:DNA primase [archaeon]|nr:DNA primase [archaeon]